MDYDVIFTLDENFILIVIELSAFDFSSDTNLVLI